MIPARAIAGSCAGFLLAFSPGLWAQESGAEDPLVLFSRMMPVFGHPRCTGCHGRVNPTSEVNNNHGGGLRAADDDCRECHITTANWRVAPDHFRFVNKGNKELCRMQSSEVHRDGDGALAKAAYFYHLEKDPLIALAFIGLEAGADEDDIAQPPGMGKPEFLDAARAWLNDGDARCRNWVGTITQEETFGSNYSYPMPSARARTIVSVQETARRTVVITLADGSATMKTEMSGSRTTRVEIHDIGPNGPCTTTVIDNGSWSGSNTGKAGVRVKIEPDGSYHIRFVGDPEKTTGGSSHVQTGDCGPNPTFPVDPPIELEWPAWPFNIRAKLPDPQQRHYLNNDLTETVVADGHDAADKRSWLEVSPVSAGRADDGSPLSVQVTTTWNLRLDE